MVTLEEFAKVNVEVDTEDWRLRRIWRASGAFVVEVVGGRRVWP